jgi:hypothetical protein
MPSDNVIANFIASISAIIGVTSAILAYLSYRNTKEQYQINRLDQFRSKCGQNLDDCYIALNDFVNDFSSVNESREKRIARDKIIFLLDIFRTDIDQNINIRQLFLQNYDNLDLKISDITYEDNFEKIMRDLASVRNSIANLKHLLSNNL